MVLELIFYTLFPLLLMLFISIFFAFYFPSFIEIGMGRRELGLLFIGPLLTAFINMPIFMYRNYFLAINIGGALIPLIMSFYLIKENELGFQKILVGISIVAVATYMVTKVTNEGVISYFPFYLFPSILAFLISLLFHFPYPKACAYSYSTATLGVIIGGDFGHLPEIFTHPFMGSMGGAGMYDMVYIAGLLSFFLSFIFIKKKKGNKKDRYLKELERYLLILNDESLWKHYSMLRNLNGWRFRKEAKKLWRKIGYMLSDCFANELERMASFLIDVAIIASFSFIASIFRIFYFFHSFIASFFVSFNLLLLFYFFILEFLFNATIGKAFFGIEVRKENFQKADFIDAFTRNILRFLDMLAFFYIISIVMIAATPKKQRIGDIITGTIVVREKCLR